MSTITAANSSLVINPRLLGAFSGLLPAIAGVGFAVRGYASDDAFAVEAVDTAEARIGVDGFMSAGYLPHLTKQVITLAADSVTIPLFDALVGAQDALREVVFLDGILTLSALSKSYVLTKGVLTRFTPIPPAKKVLEPATYEIMWNVVQPAPVTV